MGVVGDSLLNAFDILSLVVVYSPVRAEVEVLDYCAEVVTAAPGLGDTLFVELKGTWD